MTCRTLVFRAVLQCAAAAGCVCTGTTPLHSQRPLIRTIPTEALPATVREALRGEATTVVDVDTDELTGIRTGASRRFLLDVGTGKIFTARLTRTSALRGAVGWRGVLEGLSHTSVVLIARNAALYGSIQVGDTIYYLAQIQDTIHTVTQRTQSGLPNELPPDSVGPPHGGDETDEGDIPPLAECPPAVVDVLVVYTPAAQAEALADSLLLTMEQRAELAVDETNFALQSSGVLHSI